MQQPSAPCQGLNRQNRIQRINWHSNLKKHKQKLADKITKAEAKHYDDTYILDAAALTMD